MHAKRQRRAKKSSQGGYGDNYGDYDYSSRDRPCDEELGYGGGDTRNGHAGNHRGPIGTHVLQSKIRQSLKKKNDQVGVPSSPLAHVLQGDSRDDLRRVPSSHSYREREVPPATLYSSRGSSSSQSQFQYLRQCMDGRDARDDGLPPLRNSRESPQLPPREYLSPRRQEQSDDDTDDRQ